MTGGALAFGTIVGDAIPETELSSPAAVVTRQAQWLVPRAFAPIASERAPVHTERAARGTAPSTAPSPRSRRAVVTLPREQARGTAHDPRTAHSFHRPRITPFERGRCADFPAQRHDRRPRSRNGAVDGDGRSRMGSLPSPGAPIASSQRQTNSRFQGIASSGSPPDRPCRERPTRQRVAPRQLAIAASIAPF